MHSILIILFFFAGSAAIFPSLAYAENYHIGIVLSKSCMGSDVCPDYDTLQSIIPGTPLNDDNLKSLQRFENMTEIQQMNTIQTIQKWQLLCVSLDVCTFFNATGQNYIWYDPPSKLHSYIDIITISPNMKIYNYNNLDSDEKTKLSKKLNEIESKISENKKQLDSKKSELRTLTSNHDDNSSILAQLQSNRGNLVSSISSINFEISNTHHSETDQLQKLKDKLKLYEDSLKKIDKQISSAKSKDSSHSSKVSSLNNDIDSLNDKQRDYSKQLASYKQSLNPRDKIYIFDDFRQINFNINQLYVDSDCKGIIFKPDFIYYELGFLFSFMKSDCKETSYLNYFDTGYNQTLPVTDIDITTSPNWQYDRWVDKVKEDCKTLCTQY